MRREPTTKDMAVYEYIVKYMMEHQYSPAVREIGDGVGFKSTSTVFVHLKALRESGLIDYEPAQPRTITLVGYKLVKMN